MLPELILREERQESYPLLFFFGMVSALVGIAAANIIFPDQADIISVFMASLPIVYPLTGAFLEKEAETEGKSFGAYLDETSMYMALFAGEVAGFFLVGLYDPSAFDIQIRVFESQLTMMGITGYASGGPSFGGILLNNLVVYAIILVVSALVGSAGAFVLTWNGSVLGVFLAVLTSELPGAGLLTGTEDVPSPLFYIPHATLEMTGFIVAGVAGTTVSAAAYRRHFDFETWRAILGLAALGVFLIVAGAFVETA